MFILNALYYGTICGCFAFGVYWPIAVARKLNGFFKEKAIAHSEQQRLRRAAEGHMLQGAER